MSSFAVKNLRTIGSAGNKVLGIVSRELDLVEDEFRRQASSNIEVINYLGEYLRSSGGKRIRPALLILGNYSVGGDGARDNVIRLATVMEMLHTATLVHDDIIDNADTRRNRPSINARFGNQAAVLMGDWLYMAAFETALAERSLEILDILTTLTRRMTEGEIIQMTMVGRLDITEETYFDILSRKTAYLFSACCEIGAILADAPPEQRATLREYGMNLGIAFQLSDDLLDVTSEMENLGKAAGSDLLEGKLTLPLIRLLDEVPKVRPQVEQVVLDGTYQALPRKRLNKMLDENNILRDIKHLADEHASAARKGLEALPDSEYRSTLERVLDFVIERSS
ncbi:MAG: polyprenyl synthetase family protein [Acidobacteria bacterium]|nr:polyprenyl synthetase family protein [Acidobacteriota bacterium]